LWWVGHDAAERTPSSVETARAGLEPKREPLPAPIESAADELKPAAADAVPKSDVTATENSPSPAPTTKPTAPETVAAVPAPAPLAPNAPVSQLVLYVHEDSWADVRDAQQRRLLYETIPAGRVVSVDGVAPLSVFLGNVDGVTVEFNGQPYDTARHKRGQVARFTLGSPPS
jgi:cytoskeleton protein RodZ